MAIEPGVVTAHEGERLQPYGIDVDYQEVGVPLEQFHDEEVCSPSDPVADVVRHGGHYTQSFQTTEGSLDHYCIHSADNRSVIRCRNSDGPGRVQCGNVEAS